VITQTVYGKPAIPVGNDGDLYMVEECPRELLPARAEKGWFLTKASGDYAKPPDRPTATQRRYVVVRRATGAMTCDCWDQAARGKVRRCKHCQSIEKWQSETTLKGVNQCRNIAS
jgi:hypothetical protein